MKIVGPFPWVATEVLEGYLSCTWVGKVFPLRSMGSKPKPGSPAQSISAGKRHQHNIWLWKEAGFLSTRKRWLETQAPLKGPRHKILFAATHPRFSWWKAEWTSHVKKVWGLWLWGESRRVSCWDPCGESFSHTTDAIFLGWSTPPPCVSAWGEAIAPP